MSQCGLINFELLAQQQQEQLAALQAQLQALQKRMGEGGVAEASTKVARLQVFDGTISKVSRFITACRLYIRMKIRRLQLKSRFNGYYHMYREGWQMCERKIC